MSSIEKNGKVYSEISSDRKNTNVSEFLDHITWQLACFDLVKSSDFYFHTLSDNRADAYPYVSWTTMSSLLADSYKNAQAFAISQHRSKDIGNKLITDKPTLDEVAKKSGDLLEDGYSLVRNFQQLNSAKPAPSSNFPYLPGVSQVYYRQVLSAFPQEKGENFRETLRRYIPRWMHHPISYPEGERSDVGWGEYKAKDANLLIHPDAIHEGKAPLNIVFKQAKAVEKEGNLDLGFTLRTWGLTSLLAMESEGFKKVDNPEIPFFTFIMAGVVTGEVPPPKAKAFFDYQSAIRETIRLTFSRAQSELTRDQNGSALGFLETLASYYPEQFPQLLGRSILNNGFDSKEIDEIQVLKGLGSNRFSWGSLVSDDMEWMSRRRVLTTTEASSLIGQFPDPRSKQNLDEVTAAVSEMVSDNDRYGFRVQMARLDLASPTMKGELEVELDSASESIEATARFKSADKTRYLPFQISYSGEKESLIMETIDDNPDDLTADSYRGLVVRAISYEASKIQAQKDTGKDHKPQTTAPVVLSFRGLTREERVSRYDQIRRQAAGRRKTQGIASIQAEPVVDQSEVKEPVDDQSGIKVLGAEIEDIKSLLDEENIELISPEDLQRRLIRDIEVARLTKKMLGKRVNMDNYGERYKSINLRQLNWVLEGRTALRIFLEDRSEATFKLRGVFNKKSEDKQTRYIGGIARDILKERAARTEETD